MKNENTLKIHQEKMKNETKLKIKSESISKKSTRIKWKVKTL